MILNNFVAKLSRQLTIKTKTKLTKYKVYNIMELNQLKRQIAQLEDSVMNTSDKLDELYEKQYELETEVDELVERLEILYTKQVLMQTAI